jgi:hypothetical protein
MLHFAAPLTLAQGLSLFFALLIGHALADYPLQGDFLALHKNRHYNSNAQGFPPGVWLHCLISHALIHAGFVWLITGNVILGLCELVLHTLIDFIKCEKLTNFHTDQALHVLSKALFVVMIMQGWV